MEEMGRMMEGIPSARNMTEGTNEATITEALKEDKEGEVIAEDGPDNDTTTKTAKKAGNGLARQAIAPRHKSNQAPRLEEHFQNSWSIWAVSFVEVRLQELRRQ